MLLYVNIPWIVQSLLLNTYVYVALNNGKLFILEPRQYKNDSIQSKKIQF